MIRKAVIPAAGFGTRFLPITKAMPKEMLPIIDKPVIQYIVEEALKSGIEDIIIVTGRGKYSIENYFDKSFELEHVLKNKGDKEKLDIVENVSKMADIFYVRQKEQLGLADAIRTAKNHLDGEEFAVLLGDVIVESKTPSIKQLEMVMEKHKASVIGVEEVKMEEIHKFGIVKGRKIDSKTLEIEDFIEKPKPEKAPSNLASMGRYVFTPEIFDAIDSIPISKGEYLLPDATLKLAKKHKALAHVINGRVYSVGDKMEFLKATVELGLKREDLKDFKKMLEQIIKNGFD